MCKQGLLKEAVQRLDLMDRHGIRACSDTYARLLQGCAKMKALADGKQVHAHMVKSGFEPDLFVGNSLVSMYVKCGSVGDARRVFDKMLKRDVVSWTAMIAGYAQHGIGNEALALFRQMQRECVNPNKVTFLGILNACASPVFLEEGKRVHSLVTRSGFESDVRVGNALVSMYCKCRSVVDARKVFDSMSRRDVVSWNAMIAGFAQHGYGEDALELFGRMQLDGVKPDSVTFLSILTACANPGALAEGKQVHAHILRSGFEYKVPVANALISMYVRCGSVLDARQLFNKMPERDVVSWNAMILGYAQHGHDEKAFDLFQKMQHEGMKPDTITFMGILNVFASLAALEEGKRVHGLIVGSGFDRDVRVGTTLINMYAKCGSLVNAREVFDKMPHRNVVSWTAMILGYSQHGYTEEVFELFGQMQHLGLKPDKITFVGVLSACSHAGLVNEGLHYFHAMSHNYGISPTEEHCACMVDLLGRAGRLEEAEDFINKMPLEPGASTWGALLGACRIHGNVELAELAAEQKLRLEPDNAGVYVLLSNIYAAAGRWDDKAKVRTVMEDKGVKKEPGCSWIEVNNRVYVFISEDRSHPQTEKIYAELEGLTRQMKEAGFVLDKRFLLQKEQIELSLCYHSEKLAIAFGLISTPPGTTIRIIKTLEYVETATQPPSSYPRLLDEKLLQEMLIAFIILIMGCAPVGIIGDHELWNSLELSNW